MLTELVLNTLPMLQEKGTACFKKLLSRSQCVSMLYYSGIFPMWQAQCVCSQLLCPLCDSGTEHPSPVAAWLLSARGRCSSAPQAVGTAALWLLGTPQCVTLPAQHQSPLVLWGSAKQTQLENTAESPLHSWEESAQSIVQGNSPSFVTSFKNCILLWKSAPPNLAISTSANRRLFRRLNCPWARRISLNNQEPGLPEGKDLVSQQPDGCNE